MRHRKLLSGSLAALGAALLLTASPVRAQEGDPASSGEPGLVDGLWAVNVVSSGPVEIGEAHATVSASGGGLMTVADEVVGGEYTIDATNVVVAPDSGATGSLHTVGEWGGTATKPAMIDGDSTIEGTVTVEGESQDVSFTMPSTGAMTVIPIISATCTVVEGDWPTVANAAFAGTGASPSLDGVWIAIRLLDAMPGDEPPDYASEAFAVHTDGLLFYAETADAGTVDFARLDDLLTRAEDLYDRLQRSADCGIGAAGAYQSVLAAMTGQLLRFALDNPDSFDNMALLRLVTAATRMGLIGSGAAFGDYSAELSSDLIADLENRMEQADEADDCDGALAVSIIGSVIGDADFIGMVGGACGG